MQGDKEWLQRRAGKITASEISNVLAKGKRDGRPLKARQDYLTKIVVEILTGEPQEAVLAAPQVQYGQDVEPYARAAYEAHTGRLITEVDFVEHPDYPYIGCSPDGQLIQDGKIIGGCEIKCPYKSTVHMDTLLHGMPAEHYPQVQASIWVHGVDWWDFASYDPRFPLEMRLHIERINRNDKYIATMAEECEAFWEEVTQTVDALRKKSA